MALLAVVATLDLIDEGVDNELPELLLLLVSIELLSKLLLDFRLLLVIAVMSLEKCLDECGMPCLKR